MLPDLWTDLFRVMDDIKESVRIAAAKNSSMMVCVNYVLQFVDGAEILSLLVPKLIDLIKKSVGLGTKGTAAHVVITLTHQCPQDLQVFTGKFLAAFVTGLADRNPGTWPMSSLHCKQTAVIFTNVNKQPLKFFIFSKNVNKRAVRFVNKHLVF